MSAGLIALLLIGLSLLLSAPAFVVARRSASLFATDFALVAAPPFAFLLALVAFNEPAQTGWAPIGYPFAVLLAGVLMLQARVFIAPRLGFAPRSASTFVLFIAVVAASLFGAFTPPWYE